MTWSNRLTVGRLLLTPVFLIALSNRVPVWPLVIFFLAALTDVLDGALARAWKQRTRLGAFLDPIADKLLLGSSFLVLAVLGVLPMWVFIVVFSRDLMILIGWNVVYVLTQSATVEPRWLGKSTTFLQMAVVVVALIPEVRDGLLWVLWPMVVATTLSSVEYVWIGSKKIGALG